MRPIVLGLLLSLSFGTAFSQQLSYFLPDSLSYDRNIPQPKDVIFHEPGEFHVTHDRLVNYMQAIAAAAPHRVKLETMGFTFEKRPQVVLVITAKKNLDRLETIRQQHLQLGNPAVSATFNLQQMPVVVYIGHSIHGNESSGANASLVTAYYLAAAQGGQIDDLLDNTIILLDPSFNPDGLQRFSTWANQHRSKNLVTDPNSREFNETWPGGRFNHYWFDLNRDWLTGIHPETRNRINYFFKWKPNILTDHHEQGSNASFFFQPGVPSRVNPLTPARAQELTEALGKYHARYLDRIGSLYFTREAFDDFYYGKGSTFPDINGGIGILFEQASSRGHAQQTTNGILRFEATIRNQFVTALSTLEGARQLRVPFLEYQREFYTRIAATPTNKGFVFGDDNDKARSFHFIEMLQRQNIEVYELSDSWKDNAFKKGSAYFVPLDQSQQLVVKAFFDKQLSYADSVFYDITSWTMPLAFNLPFREVDNARGIAGKKLDPVVFPAGKIAGGKAGYAYLFEWSDHYAPRALYELQAAGLLAKAATREFALSLGTGNKQFSYGTILVPVHHQTRNAEDIYRIMQGISSRNAITIYSSDAGNAVSGIDLGSSKFVNLALPSIAMITGKGVNAIDAGEVWHLLDQQMNIPSSHLEPSTFNTTDLGKYNTIILVGGTYAELNPEKLKAWVQAGGTLILEEEAVSWAARHGISNVRLRDAKPAVDSSMRISYLNKEQLDGAQRMAGAIFSTTADLTHPLAYGYTHNKVPFFKSNRVFMERAKNPYATPFEYPAQPLVSGWLSRQNESAIKNSGAVIVNTLGSGRVVNIADNPNLRGFWLGGTKLMMNAIYFARLIDAESAR